jgi:hypothetical protein
MEAIYGVIEDLLDRLTKGSPDDKEDAKNELKMNLAQFTKNLSDINTPEANALLARLKSAKV